jgi:hypothetical protein
MSQARLLCVGLFIAMASAAGCSAVEAPGATETEAHSAAVPIAGWYMQNASGAIFQPCGSVDSLVVDAPDLTRRARDFNLQDDLPVYVRLRGSRHGNAFEVASVEQFGSPMPVRDCPMAGTQIMQ